MKKAFSPFRRRAERTEVAESAFTLEHDHSVLGHTTDTEADYGTALCWAENAVGAQKAPCAFREDGRRARHAVANSNFQDSRSIGYLLLVWIRMRPTQTQLCTSLLIICTLILPVFTSFTNN